MDAEATSKSSTHFFFFFISNKYQTNSFNKANWETENRSMLKQTAIACLPLGMGSWLGLILMTTVVHLITQFKQSSFLYMNIRTPIQIQDHPSKASKFTSTPGTLRVLNEAHRCGPLCNTQQGPLMSESMPHTNYILTKWVFEGEAGNGYYR